MKGILVVGTCFIIGMLLMVPSIAAVEWNEGKHALEDIQGKTLEENVNTLLETNDNPILTQILIRIISSIGSKIISKLTQNKVVLGLILQLLWLMVVRNYITPMLTGTE
jgi:hypothetical protein